MSHGFLVFDWASTAVMVTSSASYERLHPSNKTPAGTTHDTPPRQVSRVLPCSRHSAARLNCAIHAQHIMCIAQCNSISAPCIPRPARRPSLASICVPAVLAATLLVVAASCDETRRDTDEFTRSSSSASTLKVLQGIQENKGIIAHANGMRKVG